MLERGDCVVEVLGFYNGLDERAKGYPYLIQYGSLLDYLAIFQMPIQANGELEGAPSRQLVQQAQQQGIKTLLVVSNLTARGQFSTPLLSRLLRDQEFSSRVYQNIRNMLLRYQLDGVNLDLEKAAPEDRLLYTRFIDRWTRQFRRENFLVTIDVPAKKEDAPTDEWQGAFDYRALGQMDFTGIILMTYEEHWAASEPGSVASLPWVNQVVDYATANIPASKLFLGIPLYGYDWVVGGRGQAIGYERSMELARRYGAPIQWNERQHSAFFRYTAEDGRRHIVYFENRQSFGEKMAVVRRRNLRGIALWEMNLSYPEFWRSLQTYIEREY